MTDNRSHDEIYAWILSWLDDDVYTVVGVNVQKLTERIRDRDSQRKAALREAVGEDTHIHDDDAGDEGTWEAAVNAERARMHEAIERIYPEATWDKH